MSIINLVNNDAILALIFHYIEYDDIMNFLSILPHALINQKLLTEQVCKEKRTIEISDETTISECIRYVMDSTSLSHITLDGKPYYPRSNLWYEMAMILSVQYMIQMSNVIMTMMNVQHRQKLSQQAVK